MQIILIGGKARSGKDTTADIFIKELERDYKGSKLVKFERLL